MKMDESDGMAEGVDKKKESSQDHKRRPDDKRLARRRSPFEVDRLPSGNMVTHVPEVYQGWSGLWRNKLILNDKKLR